MANEVPRAQAIELCALYTRIGTDPEALHAGQDDFANKPRIEWRPR